MTKSPEQIQEPQVLSEDIQQTLVEIISVLVDTGSNVSDRAERLKKAVDSLNGKSVPQKIGESLIRLFKTIPEAYHLENSVMNVFLGLGVTFTKNQKGDYTVYTAPNTPDSTAAMPTLTNAAETLSKEPEIDYWPITDTRDYHEVPNIIAYKIDNNDSYRFQHSGAPGTTFSWSNRNLQADSGDESSDSVLKGNLLQELRSKQIMGSITLSTGEVIDL